MLVYKEKSCSESINKLGTAENSRELQKSRSWGDQCSKEECIYQNQLKQGALVHFEELLVPDRNVIRPLLLVFVILGRWGVIFVVGAPLNYLQGTRVNN